MMTRIQCLFLAGFWLFPVWCVAAPGDPDGSFAPELRRSVIPGSVLVAPDGKILLGGSWEGFDRIDGQLVGDRVLLDEDGTPIGEVVPKLLEPALGFPVWDGFGSGSRKDWFPLEAGRWLVPVSSGRWLKLEGFGPAEAFFADVPADQRIYPQFLRDGKLWVTRIAGENQRTVEVRRSSDGTLETSFQQAADWPELPLQCVPAADGGAWVLGGDAPPLIWWPGLWPPETKINRVFRVTASGALDESVAPRVLDHYRSPQLRARPDGYQVLLGRDRRMDLYSPRPATAANRIGWFDAEGEEERWMTLYSGFYSLLLWEDAGDGKVVATGPDGFLRRYLANGEVDPTFESSGPVSSLTALPGGKWLVNGTRRLLPDGQADPSWHAVEPTAPGQVRSLHALDDGRVLVAGLISQAGGRSVSHLAILRGDGSPDPAFDPDPRVNEPLSVAVSGGKIYVVTQRPVALPGGRSSHLIQLEMDGSLEESFDPEQDTQFWVQRFTRVFAQPDGSILAEGQNGGDVISTSLFRMNASGELLARFPSTWASYGYGAKVLPLAGGGVIIGSSFYSEDGDPIRAVGGAANLQPVCEWQGGVLFVEDLENGSAMQRFRLWKNGRWAPGFAAEPIRANPGVLDAVEGADQALHLIASWDDGTQRMRRMLADGSMDASFVPPSFTYRPRRDPGPWKVADDGGLVDFDPASMEQTVLPANCLFHSGTATLWVGGRFHQVNGMNRDGLVRLEAGSVPPLSGPPRSAYESWAIGMQLGSSGPDDDDDGDGVPNLLEFLFGTHPKVHSEGVKTTLEEEKLIFSYAQSLEAIDAESEVEFSEDLEEWTLADESNADFTTEPLVGDVMRVKVAVSREGRDRLFFRLRTSIP